MRKLFTFCAAALVAAVAFAQTARAEFIVNASSGADSVNLSSTTGLTTGGAGGVGPVAISTTSITALTITVGNFVIGVTAATNNSPGGGVDFNSNVALVLNSVLHTSAGTDTLTVVASTA